MQTKILFGLFSLMLYACVSAKEPGTIYINSNTVDEKRDGSVEHPFKSFDEVTFRENTRYKIKKNSVFQISAPIYITKKGIAISSYGKGNLPVFILRSSAATNIFIVENASDISISNIHLQINNNNQAVALLVKRTSGTNLDNVFASGGKTGIVFYQTKGVNLLNQCKVSDTFEKSLTSL